MKLDTTGSDTYRCYLPAVWPWASCLTYLSHSMCIKKKRVTVPPKLEGGLRKPNVQNLAHRRDSINISFSSSYSPCPFPNPPDSLSVLIKSRNDSRQETPALLSQSHNLLKAFICNSGRAFKESSQAKGYNEERKQQKEQTTGKDLAASRWWKEKSQMNESNTKSKTIKKTD